MSEDTVISLKNPGAPGSVADALTEILREGAQQLLASAIEAEVRAFLQRFQDEKTPEGLQRVVRNGGLPKRTIQTGIGAVEISLPRVRDRESQLRFTSAQLPPYLRRTKTLEELLPWLYLKGVSTGDFQEALERAAGQGRAGLIGEYDQPLKGKLER